MHKTLAISEVISSELCNFSTEADIMADEKHDKGGLFKRADAIDMALMAAGFIGSVGDGLALPAMISVKARLVNDIGSAVTSHDLHLFVHSINKHGLIMCGIAVAAWVFSFVEGYCWTRTAERQTGRIRAKYLKAVLRQDMGYFDTNSRTASQVVASVSSDTLIIQDCISEKLPYFLASISTFIGCYAMAFVLLWRLALVTFPFVVVLVVPGIVYGRVLKSLIRKMRNEYGKAESIAEEAISSVRTVYAFVEECNTISAFSEGLQGLLKIGLKQGLAKAFAMGNIGLSFAVWSFTTWYATKLVVGHGAKGGYAFAVTICINQGGMAFGTGLSHLRFLYEAHSAVRQITEVINRVPDIDSEDKDGEILKNMTGEVEFKQVEFAYPSRPDTMVLRDFSLKVSAGKTIALVGRSGSGKSTVTLLLQRFYKPLGGKILLDGVAIEKIQLKWLRSQMGMVSQEPILFSTTIKENILFGKEDASMEEVIEAAKASNAHSFITQLPDSYNTQVGERGVQLSGGQKQRIAIARAIIRKPRVLLLDEATSALDSESERTVQEALDRVSEDTTTIVVAHRLSTIRHAHIISVVQAGQVEESGSHDELLRLPHGIYTSLLQHQEIKTSKDDPKQSQGPQMAARSPSNPVHLEGPVGASDLSPQKNKGGKPYFRMLLKLNKPQWKMGLLGCLCSVIFGAVTPVFFLALGSIIHAFFLPNKAEIKRESSTVFPILAGLAVLALLTNATQHYCFAYIGEKLMMRMRKQMLTAILRSEVGWFDRDENATGSVCSRLTSDANDVRCLVGDRASVMLQGITMVLVSAIMGLVISWRLAIVMIAVQPFIVVSLYTRRVLLRKMSTKTLKSQEESSKLASEAISNIRTINAFNSQSLILKMLKQTQVGPRRENIRQSWYTGVCFAVAHSLSVLSTVFNFWYGSRLLVRGQVDPRQIFQTILVLEAMGRVIAEMGSMTTDLAKGTNAIGSVFAVLNRVTKIEPENPKGIKPDHIKGDIMIEGVDFAYPSRPSVMIFKGFSFEIQAGKSSALVGQSGSGKSTIIGLIERFYDPVNGVVKIDGRDIRTYHLRSLRTHMALVSQEPALFSGTIRENIMYWSNGGVDESEVVVAAKAANAHEFISGLRDGYDTRCGGKGAQLSGGQKQRIAIARAIMRKPRILLLDEATSALDNRSEMEVESALEKIMVGRTTVVVAHRLTTVQNCDTIAVLEEGKIVEMGNHSSLLAKGQSGAYYSLINLQAIVS